MILINIKMKIVLFFLCVPSLPKATEWHQANVASSQTTIFGTSGKF